MKKFWLLMLCFPLLVSLGCQSEETTSRRDSSDDLEEEVTDSSEDDEDEDVRSEARKHKKDRKSRSSFKEIDEAFLDFQDGSNLYSLGPGSDFESDIVTKPEAVEIPPYDPRRIASQAMKFYDLNKDRKLDAEELRAFPGMLFSLKGPRSIDTNSDGMIDENEIQARIQAWIDMRVGLTCPTLKFVDKRGRVAKEVIGKRVILIPDPVQEGILKKTEPIEIDENGQCSPSTPGNFENLSGMSYGFYTIKIEGMPYKNLGVEIYDGAKEEDSSSFIIELQ